MKCQGLRPLGSLIFCADFPSGCGQAISLCLSFHICKMGAMVSFETLRQLLMKNATKEILLVISNEKKSFFSFSLF